MKITITKVNLIAVVLPCLVAIFVAGYLARAPYETHAEPKSYAEAALQIEKEAGVSGAAATRRLISHARMIAVESLTITKHVINQTLDKVIETL